MTHRGMDVVVPRVVSHYRMHSDTLFICSCGGSFATEREFIGHVFALSAAPLPSGELAAFLLHDADILESIIGKKVTWESSECSARLRQAAAALTAREAVIAGLKADAERWCDTAAEAGKIAVRLSAENEGLRRLASDAWDAITFYSDEADLMPDRIAEVLERIRPVRRRALASEGA